MHTKKATNYHSIQMFVFLSYRGVSKPKGYHHVLRNLNVSIIDVMHSG